MTFEEIYEKVTAFRDERNWMQFHTPKDLSISICLEAAELLEIFQWSGAECCPAGKEEKIKEELADVLMYCILMADRMQLNIPDIIEEKLKLNQRKYPAELCRNSAAKYTELKTAADTSEI